MNVQDIFAEEPRPNVKLIVFAALTMLVLIAGVTRSLHRAAQDETAAQEVAADPAGAVHSATPQVAADPARRATPHAGD